MRISDWSSDVCSSDLPAIGDVAVRRQLAGENDVIGAKEGVMHRAATGEFLAMTAPALACRKCGAGDFNAHRAARAASRIGHPLAPLTPRHEGELFEQHHILLILEQRAVERRDRLADIAVLEHLDRKSTRM